MVDSDVVGLVERVKDTRKGPKIMLRVLAGSLSEGDEVELIHPDGSGQAVRIVGIGERPLTPESTLIQYGAGEAQGTWHRQEAASNGVFREGDLFRAPGAHTLRAPEEPREILAEIAAARAEGRMRRGANLSDAVVALHLLHCAESAVKHSQGAMTTSGQYLALADTLDAYGLAEQADRSRLVAAAVLEGYEPGPSVRGLASITAGVLNVPASFKSPLLVQGIALAMEQGDGFASGYQSGVRGSGEGIRVPLQREGRAVALAWCKKCGDVRQLDAKMKCEACGKRIKDGPQRVVVPADVPEATAELRAARARSS